MVSPSVLTEAAFSSQMDKSETLLIDAGHLVVLPRPKLPVVCFAHLEDVEI